MKIETEDEEYNLTFIYGFDDEELGSIFFAQTDVISVLCFNYSIKERFASLMQNEFPHEAEVSVSSIILKVNRDNYFEKIIEVIDKLKTIN